MTLLKRMQAILDDALAQRDAHPEYYRSVNSVLGFAVLHSRGASPRTLRSVADDYYGKLLRDIKTLDTGEQEPWRVAALHEMRRAATRLAPLF